MVNTLVVLLLFFFLSTDCFVEKPVDHTYKLNSTSTDAFFKHSFFAKSTLILSVKCTPSADHKGDIEGKLLIKYSYSSCYDKTLGDDTEAETEISVKVTCKQDSVTLDNSESPVNKAVTINVNNITILTEASGYYAYKFTLEIEKAEILLTALGKYDHGFMMIIDVGLYKCSKALIVLSVFTLLGSGFLLLYSKVLPNSAYLIVGAAITCGLFRYIFEKSHFDSIAENNEYGAMVRMALAKIFASCQRILLDIFLLYMSCGFLLIKNYGEDIKRFLIIGVFYFLMYCTFLQLENTTLSSTSLVIFEIITWLLFIMVQVYLFRRVYDFFKTLLKIKSDDAQNFSVIYWRFIYLYAITGALGFTFLVMVVVIYRNSNGCKPFWFLVSADTFWPVLSLATSIGFILILWRHMDIFYTANRINFGPISYQAMTESQESLSNIALHSTRMAVRENTNEIQSAFSIIEEFEDNGQDSDDSEKIKLFKRD